MEESITNGNRRSARGREKINHKLKKQREEEIWCEKASFIEQIEDCQERCNRENKSQNKAIERRRHAMREIIIYKK